MDLKFYKCLACGKIIEMLKETNAATICCGTNMQELLANTNDGAVEKHVPVITHEGCKVTVSVGEVIHPMEENHYIEWIYLVTNKGYYRFNLNPGDTPVINFILNDGESVIKAYAYCNLHGLWVSN